MPRAGIKGFAPAVLIMAAGAVRFSYVVPPLGGFQRLGRTNRLKAGLNTIQMRIAGFSQSSKLHFLKSPEYWTPNYG
jgi:hypothetical protein